MLKHSLNEHWRLHEAPLDCDRSSYGKVLAESDGWLPCQLPCDVHMPLQEAGVIRDVTKADYCHEAEWIEKRSWWFENTFTASAEEASADVCELVLESLDAHADVFLNGTWIGEHNSAHYPFIKGVKGIIHAGENTLVVRMTTGFERVTDRDLAEVDWLVCMEWDRGLTDRSDYRRACVRKPQYVVGWDWAPRVVTCGIVKNAWLQSWNKAAIRSVHITTQRIEPHAAFLHAVVEVDQAHVYASRNGDVVLTLTLGGQSWRFEAQDRLLLSGINYIDMDLVLPEPALWWPNGYGAQPLYDVSATVACEGTTCAFPVFRYGVRTIELDTRRVDDVHRNFMLIVNGVPVFCKGGDWIPADSVYARVTDEKYETLLLEAQRSNMNMLRIWGGGIYERDVFYDACDRLGILLWHDFMFGCSAYPDHLEWFRRECRREMDYQTRRLRTHACMALWCGNNEDPMIFNDRVQPKLAGKMNYQRQWGMYTANEIAPEVIRNNCPEIPYWPSSPYGGDMPNDETCGDVHHWQPCMMNAEMARRIEPREYDKVAARFVTEYGYPGPCSMASIETFFDGRPVDRQSPIWALHNNSFEKDTVLAGIHKHYLDDVTDLSLPDYLLYAGMVQMTMLQYSLEAIRFKDFCGGALFWMYNDTWCEVGWTIIDYYLRRKIAYYGVKRAFAPVKLSLRPVDGKVVLQGCNDTERPIVIKARIGYVPLDGSHADLSVETLNLPAHSRVYCGKFDLPEADYRKGVFAVIPEDETCDPAALRQCDIKELHFAGAVPRILSDEAKGGRRIVRLTADAALHGVHINAEREMSDNYFDLLPGQVKTVTLAGEESCPAWHAVL